MRRQAIEGSNDLQILFYQVLGFFGVANRNAWEKLWRSPEAAFRQSAAFQADEYAVATWLRLGELEAAQVRTDPFDRAAFRFALDEARALMTGAPDEFFPATVDLCAQAGVALVLVPEIKGARASGASRWTSPTKAIIQLSMRYRWEDHFWFSFFHEGGHLYLHGKRRAFVDLPAGPDEGAVPDGEYEAEANRFAQDILIPPSEAASLSGLEARSDIIDFAQRLSIPPGVVVGRMQREGYLPWHLNNDLRRRFVLVEE